MFTVIGLSQDFTSQDFPLKSAANFNGKFRGNVKCLLLDFTLRSHANLVGLVSFFFDKVTSAFLIKKDSPNAHTFYIAM